MEKVKILFISANPTGTAPLDLNEEYRKITQRIRAGGRRDALEIVPPVLAARPEDVIDALLQHKPQVVHFSGHGGAPVSPADGGAAGRRDLVPVAGSDGESYGLYLLNDQGRPAAVGREALVGLVGALSDNIRVVLLNACHSHELSGAIAQVIDCAIGMDAAIADKSAIEFAAAFYQAIAYGRSVETAFRVARSAISLYNLPGQCIPQLFVKEGVSASKLYLTERPAWSRLAPRTWPRPYRWLGGIVLGLALSIATWGAAHWVYGYLSFGSVSQTIAPEMLADLLHKRFDNPLVGRKRPNTESADYGYYRLRQAVFLTANEWRGDRVLLGQALKLLEMRGAFGQGGRDDSSYEADKLRLFSELDDLLRARYRWLVNEVLPGLKGHQGNIGFELPPLARVSFGDKIGEGPKQTFSSNTAVEQEVKRLESSIQG
jgi:hypothetical protein